jgi:hypothetical protein
LKPAPILSRDAMYAFGIAGKICLIPYAPDRYVDFSPWCNYVPYIPNKPG